MFFRYNDNELIYLYREGVEKALNELYLKYEHLIVKLYKQKRNYGVPFEDFYQEGLMILHKSINRYDLDSCVSFYTFYSICLSRRSYRVSKEYRYLYESYDYNADVLADRVSNHNFNLLIKEFKKINLDIGVMIEYCIKRNVSIKVYCLRFNKVYEKMYYEYKKFLKEFKKKVD